ncbi:hypothetical protein NG895_22940 [Aeoliella sp. ICT_H6.2]|uniref:Uncharacterized protein n=1 Tax=Aeoliella straminimaris TaxID=2954799 RepID=A0A9X2FDR8_9BACT|nr:hypothetical protein [Aeoliella straminimaris]MCO6046764.1 hypothetical protein [Aeoliella straminimaris]
MLGSSSANPLSIMRLLRWPVPVHVHIEWPKFVQRILARAIRPVVVKTVRLRHLIQTEDGEPDSLVAVLEFNGEQANVDDPEHIDLAQLKSSLNNDGTFFIWTCSCGAPGCAGMFDGVRVSHRGDVTNWHDIDCKRKYTFKSQDLRDAYVRGIIDGVEKLNARSNLEPVPDQNGPAYCEEG